MVVNVDLENNVLKKVDALVQSVVGAAVARHHLDVMVGGLARLDDARDILALRILLVHSLVRETALIC